MPLLFRRFFLNIQGLSWLNWLFEDTIKILHVPFPHIWWDSPVTGFLPPKHPQRRKENEVSNEFWPQLWRHPVLLILWEGEKSSDVEVLLRHKAWVSQWKLDLLKSRKKTPHLKTLEHPLPPACGPKLSNLEHLRTAVSSRVSTEGPKLRVTCQIIWGVTMRNHQ